MDLPSGIQNRSIPAADPVDRAGETSIPRKPASVFSDTVAQQQASSQSGSASTGDVSTSDGGQDRDAASVKPITYSLNSNIDYLDRLPEDDQIAMRDGTVSALKAEIDRIDQSIDALGPGYSTITDALREDRVRAEAELAAWEGSRNSTVTENQYFGIPNSDNSDSSGSPERKTEDQLIQENAPILVLPEGDYNLPADPQDFIDNSRLIHERSFDPKRPWKDFRDIELGDNTNESTEDDFTAEQVSQSDYPIFLDLDNDKRGELGDKNAPFFYQTEKNDDGETTRITYFFHYAYNEGPGIEYSPFSPFPFEVAKESDGAGQIRQDHEGDWERITVEIDPETQEATHIVFSAHEAPHDRRDISEGEVEFRDGHPVVYVADGSHGSYADPGIDHKTSDPTGVLKDRTAIDTNGDGLVDENDEGVVVINTSNNSLLVTEDQAWYPVTGPGVRYGEIGNTPWTNGVTGPSEEKGHVNENGNG